MNIILEDKLLEEIDGMSDYPIEQYDPEIKKVRKLGNILLKSCSKIESYMDKMIMSWVGGYGGKIAMVTELRYLQKYSPLLSGMFFLGKIKALVEYKIVKEDDKLHKSLRWLNSERDLFAHYNVYRYLLEKKYGSGKQRMKTLKKLKDIILKMKILQEAILLSNEKLKEVKD